MSVGLTFVPTASHHPRVTARGNSAPCRTGRVIAYRFAQFVAWVWLAVRPAIGPSTRQVTYSNWTVGCPTQVWYTCSVCVASRLHGPHHTLHKSSTVHLPSVEDRENDAPFWSGAV